MESKPRTSYRLLIVFNPDFQLGFVTMADAFFEALFEAVLLRMRRQ